MGRRVIKVLLYDDDPVDAEIIARYEASGKYRAKSRFARDCFKAGYTALRGNGDAVRGTQLHPDRVSTEGAAEPVAQRTSAQAKKSSLRIF